MEKAIIRSVALLCAIGGLGLAWALGAFAAIPLRDGRIFSMAGNEAQLIGVSFGACLLVAWGSLHLLSIADKVENPRAYKVMRLAYGAALIAACAVGATWSMARVVSL
jgi:hypothetical protein